MNLIKKSLTLLKFRGNFFNVLVSNARISWLNTTDGLKIQKVDESVVYNKSIFIFFR